MRVNVSASLFVTDRPDLSRLNLMNASQKVDLELGLAANARLNYLPGMGGVARILDKAGERPALVNGGSLASLSPRRRARSAPCAATAPTGAAKSTGLRSTSSTASAFRAAAARPATTSGGYYNEQERPSERDSSV